MPQVIDPKAYIIGAAEVYYRAVHPTTGAAVQGPWTSVGATTGDVSFKVPQTIFNPSGTFNGVLAEVAGMDYVSKQEAEATFEMPEIAGPKLALALVGASSAAAAITETGAGFATTLAAATAIGATNIKVASVTTVTVGMQVAIDVVAGGLREYRIIDAVGTLGAGGTGLTFRDPLLQAHSSGVVVIQTDGDGKTDIIPGLVRRQPFSAYRDWALVAQSPSAYYELFLYRAISKTQSVDIAFGDQKMAAVSVTIGAKLLGSDLTLPLWRLRVPA
jgi:hypothetical protein